MVTVIVFAVVLMAAGALIAYLGDWLGSRIGKKRLTFWKLRPRHTAYLFTTLSGALIALVTLFTLVALDSSVRIALTQGHQIVQANARLNAHNRVLSRENQQADQEAADSAQKAGIADKRAQAARLAENVADKNAAEARQKLASIQSRLSEKQNELEARQGDLRTARRDIKETQRGIARLQSERARLTASNTELQRVQKDLGGALSSTLSSTLERPLSYRKDQEVGRKTIATGLSSAAIAHTLRQFLADLSRTIAKREGRAADKQPVSVASLELQGLGGRRLEVSEAQTLQSLTHWTGTRPGNASSVIVVAYAAHNLFPGQPTHVVLQAYPNVLVFKKGDVVATTTINGALPLYSILNAMGAFLIQQVRPVAQKSGLLGHPDPKTGEPVFGAFTDSQTFTLAEAIQKAGAGAKVTAVAAEDTYTQDPLRLSWSVSP